MIYDKEINDKVLIQYIILFTINEVEKPISHDSLLTLILDNCNISFVNFQLCLDNLVNTDHIRLFTIDDNILMYELLSLGIEANKYAINKVPIYIREPISKSIEPMFRAEILRNSVQAKLLPLNKNEYMANLALYDNNTPMMELSFYAGTRAQANEIIKYFNENPNEVYGKIVHAILPDDV